jgi:hypothetical protein
VDGLKTMQGYTASVSLQFFFLGRKWDIILKEIHLKVANKLPLAKRNFYFQSCYAVGCPGLGYSLNSQCVNTSLQEARYVILLSSKDDCYNYTV